jgi:hypothetical protein
MNLSYAYSQLDRNADALQVIEESVAIAREAVLTYPGQHTADSPTR